MSITKDMILAALETQEEFLVYNGILYKKYTRISIEQKTETKKKFIGMFRTEDEIVTYHEVSAWFGDKLVFRKRVNNCELDKGDILNLRGFGGVMEVALNE